MLQPNQFAVKEVWIGFRLNDAPNHTEADGAFNCCALLGAVSGFILGSEFILANTK